MEGGPIIAPKVALFCHPFHRYIDSYGLKKGKTWLMTALGMLMGGFLVSMCKTASILVALGECNRSPPRAQTVP